MRACVSLLLALVLASVGSQPLAAFSQPQTTSGGNPPPCGCPQIQAIATSGKPDPRKSPNEVTFADLEFWWSNRESRYGGDWDKALVALAHEIDPSGGLQIWTQPAPAPSNRSKRIQEGLWANYLITGQDRLPGDRRPNQAKYSALGLPPMRELIETIARSNKYGEPTFGLRKAAIRIARFMVADLANVYRRKVLAKHRGTAAERAAMVVNAGRLALSQAIRDARTEERFRVRPEQEAHRAQLAQQRNQLFLDVNDLANAALDIILSVDDKDRREVALGVYGGLSDAAASPTNGQAYFQDLYNLSAPARQAYQNTTGVVFDLVSIAAGRQVFGGVAPPGSPADAVACKAFAAVVALADIHARDGSQVREALVQHAWAGNPGQAWIGYAPWVKGITAALILAGLSDTDRTTDWATLMYRAGVNVAVHTNVPREDVKLSFTMMRNMMAFGKGPGKTAFVSAANKWFDTLASNLQNDAAEDAKPPEQRRNAWNDGGNDPVTGFYDTTRIHGYVFGPPDSERRQSSERFHSAWQAAAPDYKPQEIDPFCPPAAATPRIIIFAVGANGRIMIKKLYVGVPTVLGVIFPEPYDGDGYPVTIQSGGGQLTLTARPKDDKHLLFETEEFVIHPK